MKDKDYNQQYEETEGVFTDSRREHYIKRVEQMKDKELEERFKERAKEVLKRAHERPYGDPDVGRWDEYNDLAALVEAKNNLIAQERRKAKIEVVKSLISKARVRYWREAEADIQAVDLTDLLKLLAELKEDKGGNKGE